MGYFDRNYLIKVFIKEWGEHFNEGKLYSQLYDPHTIRQFSKVQTV